MTKTILVFDDEEKFSEEWITRLNENPYVEPNFELDKISNEDFIEFVHDLGERQELHRLGEPFEIKSILDEDTIFFIDYDLLNTKKGYYFTGEHIAYLVRCFTDCGLVVGLNQFGFNTFDLNLTGHPESYCDLNIGIEQLGNTGLWSIDYQSFRPWHWPILSEYLENRKKCKEELLSNIKIPIAEILNFTEKIRIFPKSSNSFLGEEVESLSVKTFVRESDYVMSKKDRIKDIFNDRIIANIAAARLSKWIERLIIPSQNILIDAPHLISRYPSLFQGDVNKTEELNQLNNVCDFDYSLISSDIEENEYLKKHWVSRPVWFWEEISSNSEIKEIKSPWEKRSLNFKFTEDSSRFYPQKETQEFIIDVDTPYKRRYIKKPKHEDVKYRPQVRLFESR